MLKKKEREVKKQVEKHVYEAFEDLEPSFYSHLNDKIGEQVNRTEQEIKDILVKAFNSTDYHKVLS